MGNLASTLRAQGDLIGAKELWEQVLEARRRVLGPEHPRVAVDLVNLGSVLRALGQAEKARAFLEQAVSIDEAAYGSEHPEVAADLEHLADVLTELGKVDEAGRAMQRARRIRASSSSIGPYTHVVRAAGPAHTLRLAQIRAATRSLYRWLTGRASP
jgi:tetratricopeptide (TPR) repeat protein